MADFEPFGVHLTVCVVEDTCCSSAVDLDPLRKLGWTRQSKGAEPVVKAATERPSGNGIVPQGTPPGAMPVTPTRSLGARRRRPALIALSVALIAAGGLGSAAFYQMENHRIAVLAVARVVPYGDTIAPEDLRVVEINETKGLRPLSAASRQHIVGKRAAVELRPGSLLTPDQVTEQVTIRTGEALVPVAVKTDRLPVRGLTPGTRILVVGMPDTRTSLTTAPIKAMVVRSSSAGSGGGSGDSLVLDLAVPAADAADLAARTFDDRFAIIVVNTGNADDAPPTPDGAGV